MRADTSKDRASSAHDPTLKQIRGSSLLLAGRLMLLVSNLATQVLIVRYLSTTEFGAWAYALSLVALFQTVALLGLDRVVSRFVSIYHEQRRYDLLFGTIVLVVGVALLMGAVVAAGIHIFPDYVGQLVNGEAQPVMLLLVLIFLVPIEELDRVVLALLAAFSRIRAIFCRRHVLAPALRLGVVLLLMAQGSDVMFLAYGYLAASVVGLLLNVAFLLQTLQQQGLLAHLAIGRIRLPVRETFAFAGPLLIADAVWPLAQASGALLLGYFHNLDQVALFRVVMPLATLILVVRRSHTMLYTPTAARLYAKGDYAEVNELYWRTAAWLAVLSFPVFAVTFAAARPLTVWLYGAPYEAAAGVLAWLALGQYVSIALGFNVLTLKVLGRSGYVMTISVLAAAVGILLNVALIPSYGALGAAIGTACAAILHSVLKQAGLRLVPGLRVFDPRYVPLYSVIGLGVLALLIAQIALPDAASLVVAAFMSLLVVAQSKQVLQLADTFPELMRFRVARAFLS